MQLIHHMALKIFFFSCCALSSAELCYMYSEFKYMCVCVCVCVSPGRHICGEGDTISYKGQGCGPGDVLPLSRGCSSCLTQAKR